MTCWKSFQQAVGTKLYLLKTGMQDFTSKEPEVAQVANLILKKFATEQAQSSGTLEQNYFVLIGHSQGNFFAEGVAYRLLHNGGSAGSYIFRNRLGIMSFASPTSYDSVVGEPGFAKRVVHLTRGDDIINGLLSLASLGGKVTLAAI